MTPGGFDVERAMHERFAAYALGHEWFTDAPELRLFIASLPLPEAAPPPPPPPAPPASIGRQVYLPAEVADLLGVTLDESTATAGSSGDGRLRPPGARGDCYGEGRNARRADALGQLPSVPGNYGGQADVYESSAATEPKLWLKVTEPNDLNAWTMGDESAGTHEATLHLTAEDAWKLADQLRWMVENHYHGDARPGWAS